MIILNHQDYNRTDPFGDNNTLIDDTRTDSHVPMSYDKSTPSFDTGKQLPYIDDFSHPPNAHTNSEESPLVHSAADVGRSDNFRDLGKTKKCCFVKSSSQLV
jgi:hypothetical protein